MIVVQLLKCMFRADLVIRTLLSKFRVIGHKRLVLRRVGNARKGGSLGRGLVALLLEEIRRNCPGQDPNDSADARPNGAEIVVCGYPERESCEREEAQANDCRLPALLLLHVIPPFRKASPDPEVSPIYGVRGHSGRLCAALMASFGAEGRRPAVALSTSQTVRRTSTISRSFWHPAVARESRCSHGAVKSGFACRCGQVARPFAVGLPVIDGLDGELARLEYQDTKGWPLLQ